MNKRLWGSTFIVAGMAIGAGMLAIPLATAQLGFMNGLVLMFSCWGLMMVSALVMLEVTLSFDKNKNSFSQMAAITLGKPGKIIMYISFLSFIYALISAYLTGGASIISNSISYLFNIYMPNELSGLLFLITLGSFIYVGTSAVDKINSFLFAMQMIIFSVLLTLFSPNIDWMLLLESESTLLYLAAPVVLTSFGFHTVIPSLVTYMGDDAAKLKWALGFGSLIPLVCYICWEMAILGTLPLQGESSFETLREMEGSIGEMVVMLSQYVSSSNLSTALMLFANLALMTSFLGVSLSLFDFWNKNLSALKFKINKKLLAFSLTFAPPFIFTLFDPKGFEKALAYGAIFEAILCILLPVTMVYIIRKKTHEYRKAVFRVPGGAVTLGLLMIGGLSMIGFDLMINH